MIEKCSKPSQLTETISRAKESDWKLTPDVGLAAQIELDKLQKSSDPAKARMALSFRTECRKYLAAMSIKLAERSPINYSVVRQVRYKINKISIL